MADLRVVLLATTVALAVAGCTPGTPTERRSAERTTTVSAPAVRTDREPITKRFPQLGDFVEVHWQGSAAGVDTGGVPGPTDVHIQALVVLRPDTLTSTVPGHQWTPAPADWDAPLSAELRPFAPAGGAWQVSERFTADVTTTRYHGPVYLDTTSGTVFLDVIGR